MVPKKNGWKRIYKGVYVHPVFGKIRCEFNVWKYYPTIKFPFKTLSHAKEFAEKGRKK